VILDDEIYDWDPLDKRDHQAELEREHNEGEEDDEHLEEISGCPSLTFERFQSSKHDATRDELLAYGYIFDEEREVRAFAYVGHLFIEDARAWDADHREDAYYLMLGNSEYFDPKLEPLEYMLYQYALDEGITGKDVKEDDAESRSTP
jgi:hypothetical protein